MVPRGGVSDQIAPGGTWQATLPAVRQEKVATNCWDWPSCNVAAAGTIAGVSTMGLTGRLKDAWGARKSPLSVSVTVTVTSSEGARTDVVATKTICWLGFGNGVVRAKLMSGS